MAKKKKSNKKKSKRKASKPRMRGAMLSRIASAFGLRESLVDAGGGTSKAGLSDQRDIHRHNHVAMTRLLVDELFTEEYLAVRGLGSEEAAVHNDLVTQALDVVLTRYDAVAVWKNMGLVPKGLANDWLLHACGLTHELPLRLAAYHVLFGHLHPVLRCLPAWASSKGIAGWWKDMEARAATRVVLKHLYRGGELTERTVGRYRRGDNVPRGSVVDVLALRLEPFGIRSHAEDDRVQGVDELLFGLRVAVAAGAEHSVVGRMLQPEPTDMMAVGLQILTSLLRPRSDEEVMSFLRDGTGSPWWPALEEDFRGVLVLRMMSMLEVSRPQTTEPKQMWRAWAESLKGQLEDQRAALPEPELGADGPEHRMLELLEQQWHRARSFATDGRHEVPEARPRLLDEVEADGLCLSAIAPWLEYDDGTKEGMFREAVEKAPWLAHPRRMLAGLLHQQRRLDEALDVYRQAVERNPVNRLGREGLVQLLVEQEAWAEVVARPDARGSVNLDSLRARSLLGLDRFEEAERVADEVLIEHPAHPMALRVKAACLRQAGNATKAREMERRAELAERGVASPG